MTLLLIAPSCVASNGIGVFWILIFADSCERVNVGKKNFVDSPSATISRIVDCNFTHIFLFLSFPPFPIVSRAFIRPSSLRKLSFHIVYNSQAHLSTRCQRRRVVATPQALCFRADGSE